MERSPFFRLSASMCKRAVLASMTSALHSGFGQSAVCRNSHHCHGSMCSVAHLGFAERRLIPLAEISCLQLQGMGVRHIYIYIYIYIYMYIYIARFGEGLGLAAVRSASTMSGFVPPACRKRERCIEA